MYQLTANFNGIDILRGRSDLRNCSGCGGILDKWTIPLHSAEKPRNAFSVSRDGYWMVSKRFKEVCEQNGLHGAEFKPLPSRYFALLPTRTIRIEQCLEQRTLRPVCDRYREVLVNGPPRLAEGEQPPAPLEFARSDVEYGNLARRSFSIWVGDDGANILRAARLRGLDFSHHA